MRMQRKHDDDDGAHEQTHDMETRRCHDTKKVKKKWDREKEEKRNIGG